MFAVERIGNAGLEDFFLVRKLGINLQTNFMYILHSFHILIWGFSCQKKSFSRYLSNPLLPPYHKWKGLMLDWRNSYLCTELAMLFIPFHELTGACFFLGVLLLHLQPSCWQDSEEEGRTIQSSPDKEIQVGFWSRAGWLRPSGSWAARRGHSGLNEDLHVLSPLLYF